jgi:hypothetical protein
MKVVLTSATWAPPFYECVLTTSEMPLDEHPEAELLQQDVTVVDDAENFAIIQTSTKEKDMLAEVVESMDWCTGERKRTPIVVQGRDFSHVEFCALAIKLQHGVFRAAQFLRRCGWGVEDARHLLCVVGRRVH